MNDKIISNVISQDYKQQCQDLHSSDPNWGQRSVDMAPYVLQIINECAVKELLDYGAGKGRLGKALKSYVAQGKIQHPVRLTNYDPAIEEIAESPEPHQFVVCIDVLEHIEPDYLDNVLDDLKRVTKEIGFFTVSCIAANRVLPDGRNAHLIQEPPWWWLPKLNERFKIVRFMGDENHFLTIVNPK